MRRKPLLWHLYPSYLLITMLALIALTWVAWWSLRQFYFTQVTADLEVRAHLLARLLTPALSSGRLHDVDALCKSLGHETATRVTIILPSGQAISDSEENIAVMENLRQRPEVMDALAGHSGFVRRMPQTSGEDMLFLALPVTDHAHVIGIVRAALPFVSLHQTLWAMEVKLIFGALLIALIAAGINWAISRRVTYPLAEIRHSVEKFAQGDLTCRLPIPESEELAPLAEAMNLMAAQLGERMRAAIRQRNEQEAMLMGMVEGVLIVDVDEHLLRLNDAAGRLLRVDPVKARGRLVHEIIRNIGLHHFITRVLASDDPVEDIIAFHDQEERHMQIHGTLLHDEHERRMGALIVMNDVTQLRRLETLRRDFVANVSHELRTPITSIKGFVETLLEGSVADPQQAEHFLGIISRHADRLDAIIEDLLLLSRVEQQAEHANLQYESANLSAVLRAAMQLCEEKAAARHIQLQTVCSPTLTLNLVPALIEQALINLIDNAIKYSEDGTSIRIHIEQAADEVAIHIEDQGYGIAQEYLPRLFERFYRVDVSRSRKLGGTGLGLAIVKHIVQAHGGSVRVQSVLGEGSTFSLYLPLHSGIH